MAYEKEVSQWAKAARKTLETGGFIFICGNGGSAAQANHFAGELAGDRLRCISLVANEAALTALANDVGYEWVFSAQLHGLSREGDLLITLTTSDESENIVRARDTAARRGLRVVDLPRPDGMDTQEIQELHLMLLHQLWKAIRE